MNVAARQLGVQLAGRRGHDACTFGMGTQYEMSPIFGLLLLSLHNNEAKLLPPALP